MMVVLARSVLQRGTGERIDRLSLGLGTESILWQLQVFAINHNLAIYLTPPTPTGSVLGCGGGLSQDVA